MKFNGTPASEVTVASETQVTARVPAGATTGPITVTGWSLAEGANVPIVTATSATPFRVDGALNLQPALGLTAEASASAIALSWTDNSSGETGYKIERRTGTSGKWTEIARGTSPDQSGFTDTKVSSGPVYFYRVRAYKSGVSNGPYSNIATATLGGSNLNAPSDLSAGVATEGVAVDLAWQNNAAGETGTLIERMSGAGTWSEIARGTTPGQTAYRDPDVVRGQSYSYRVRVYNETGAGGYSNVASVTVPLSSGAPLGTATNLTATVVSGKIALNWTDNATAESGYKIERRTGSGGWVQLLRGSTPNQSSFLDSGVAAGVIYTYRVRPYTNGVANGGYSNEASASVSAADGSGSGS